jgi:hypothetical protein
MSIWNSHVNVGNILGTIIPAALLSINWSESARYCVIFSFLFEKGVFPLHDIHDSHAFTGIMPNLGGGPLWLLAA